MPSWLLWFRPARHAILFARAAAAARPPRARACTATRQRASRANHARGAAFVRRADSPTPRCAALSPPARAARRDDA
jgi:hypothetical protein